MIWFYYDYDKTECGSPLDNHLSLMSRFYLGVSIIMIVFTLNIFINTRELNALLLSIYLLSKLGMGITMLVFVQKDYYGSWEDNVCSSLKSLTLFWLIWNYINICITFILTFIYFIFPIIDNCC